MSLFFCKNIFAADSSLTIEQQLERLQREVSDLSYSSNKNISTDDQSQLTTSLTKFDIRIYDLEQEIKYLNKMFEDLDFEIDDLKILYEELNNKINLKLTNNIITDSTLTSKNDADKKNIDSITQENTLGTIIITSNVEDILDDNSNVLLKNNENKKVTKKITDPKIEFQAAYDLLRTGRFDEAKIAFEEFISKNKKNKNTLVGLSHYRLGQILFSQDSYREAAITLAEGYQNYPEGTKAAEMLYTLSESFIKMNKIEDACNTLKNIMVNFPQHKIFNQTKNKIATLECKISLE